MFVTFLAEHFGPEIHSDLMNTTETTFTKALEKELCSRGTEVDEMFREFQKGFEEKRPSSDGVVLVPR